MHDLVLFKYNSLPMSLLYEVISSNDLLLYWWGFVEGLKGVATGLDASKHVSCKKSRQYFLCEMKIPSFECDTSRPRKYLKFLGHWFWSCYAEYSWSYQMQIKIFMLG